MSNLPVGYFEPDDDPICPSCEELQSQVDQLMAELAAINSEKESKLQWNDKAQEWQSYPPGATLVNGKIVIVKEKFYPADKELIEQLHAQVTMLRDWFKKDNSCTCKTCWSCAGKGAAVLSQSSDTWLADHDKEVRRKVLNEAYKEVDCGITHVRWALEIISRMAKEQ